MHESKYHMPDLKLLYINQRGKSFLKKVKMLNHRMNTDMHPIPSNILQGKAFV